jgi:hypothetical protein
VIQEVAMPFIARWKWVVLGLGVWLAIGWLGAPSARGQKDEKPAEAGAKEDTTAKKLYYGVKACNNEGCHSKPPATPPTKNELICRCVEAKIWSEKDKHDLAFVALEGERGRRMGELLGYDRDPRKWKECLTCHAIWPDDKATQHFTFRLEEGVNCVSCHGAYSNWVSDHAGINAEKFRPLSRQEKWTAHGMKDLWDPLKRAELCASCHVGNKPQGKWVSHDMYAAGHPPLPGFEPATFSNEMPRHWQYLREKSPALQKELGLAEGELEETKLLLVGAAIALRENMKLLVADAASDEVKNGDGLDLAHFDCYACHHDLKADSWRLKRGYEKGRKPGRVGMRPWSTLLIRLAIEADEKKAAKLATYEKLRAALNRAFDARPYGVPVDVAAAAKEMENFADTLARSLNGRVFTSADAVRLLAAIPRLYEPTKNLFDYDSARQITWAHELLKKELVRAARKGEVKEDDPGLVKIDEELKGLREALSLRLPRKSKGETLATEYKATLERIAGWDPFRAKGLFEVLK